MMENWKPVVGWEESYEVSDHGRVRSLPRTVHRGDFSYRVKGKLLTISYNADGRAQVNVSRDGIKAVLMVSVLVLTAFEGPGEGLWCLHWDDDQTNNHISNLRWGTPADNLQDAVRNGKR